MMQMLLIVALWAGCLAALAWVLAKVARALRHRSLTYMANAGGVVGAETHGTGNRTYLSDAAITTRYLLCKKGSDEDHAIATAAVTDRAFGVITDEASAAEDLINVAILGSANGTLSVTAGGSVASFDYLIPNTDGTAIALYADGSGHGGTYYVVGRALRAHSSGEMIEFQHCIPFPVTVAA